MTFDRSWIYSEKFIVLNFSKILSTGWRDINFTIFVSVVICDSSRGSSTRQLSFVQLYRIPYLHFCYLLILIQINFILQIFMMVTMYFLRILTPDKCFSNACFSVFTCLFDAFFLLRDIVVLLQMQIGYNGLVFPYISSYNIVIFSSMNMMVLSMNSSIKFV